MSIAVLSALLLATAPGVPAAAEERFFPTETCRTCHPAIVDQHLKSHHEKAWSNPLFQAQFFREVMPAAAADPSLMRDARGCVACHAPAALLGEGPLPASPGDVPADVAGVTCDACHTIVAFEGKRPQDGKAVRRTGATKYGPFQGAGDWHHAYLELQTRSELCAICHEAANHHAVRVKSTFSEWKESPQARRGVQCQDCHMTVDGFAAGGAARYEQGSAAVVFGNQSQARERLYTHRFPGAHSRSQVEGALGLLVTVSPPVARAGGALDIRVTVDNSRAGHATPTGSADLRMLWLEVTVQAAAQVLPVPAQGRWGPGWTEGLYEIAGVGPLDPAVASGDVPRGSRIYRLVLADAGGKPTLASWEARSVLADTRLRAAEVRSERYKFTLPEELAGPLTVTAVLRYQSAPRALTGRLGVPPAEPVEVARASRTVELRAEP
jgi:Cytochrome c554 and c-prime